MAAEAPSPQVSLAVWDLPPTVVVGSRFVLKAGATSSAGCDLRGRRVDACDATGDVIASGELGGAPWPGTDALAWTELSLSAPIKLGPLSLVLRVAGSGLVPPHRDGAWHIGIMVVPPPQHTVTIEVVSKETAAAISGAAIRLGPYRAVTDDAGRALIRLAKGDYDLHIWKVGFDAETGRLHIDRDAAVRVTAATVPEESADRAWRG